MRGLARRDADARVLVFISSEGFLSFADICRKSIGICGSRLNTKRAIYMPMVPVGTRGVHDVTCGARMHAATLRVTCTRARCLLMIVRHLGHKTIEFNLVLRTNKHASCSLQKLVVAYHYRLNEIDHLMHLIGAFNTLSKMYDCKKFSWLIFMYWHRGYKTTFPDSEHDH